MNNKELFFGVLVSALGIGLLILFLASLCLKLTVDPWLKVVTLIYLGFQVWFNFISLKMRVKIKQREIIQSKKRQRYYKEKLLKEDIEL